MNTKITIVKLLEKGELLEYFSNEAIMFELISSTINNDSYFDKEVDVILENKFVEIVQLEMIQKHKRVFILNKELTQDIPEIATSIRVLFSESSNYYEFKRKIQTAVDRIVAVLNIGF